MLSYVNSNKAMSFPSNPTIGQIYNSTNNEAFIWDGSKWTGYSQKKEEIPTVKVAELNQSDFVGGGTSLTFPLVSNSNEDYTGVLFKSSNAVVIDPANGEVSINNLNVVEQGTVIDTLACTDDPLPGNDAIVVDPEGEQRRVFRGEETLPANDRILCTFLTMTRIALMECRVSVSISSGSGSFAYCDWSVIQKTPNRFEIRDINATPNTTFVNRLDSPLVDIQPIFNTFANSYGVAILNKTSDDLDIEYKVYRHVYYSPRSVVASEK